MNPLDYRSLAIFGLLGWLCVGSGCNSDRLDPETAALRDGWLLTAEPPSAMSLTQVMAGISEGGSDQAAETDDETAADETAADDESATIDEAAPSLAADVTVVGRIFAGDFEPWEAGKATFLISELPEQGHGEEHDADNCPFCKRKAAQAPKAVIEFRDAQGELVEIDARRLFDIEKQDVVVVQGTVTVGELNTLVVSATGLYVRR